VFSEQLDPRAVVTVGDQVVSEHTFGFHSRESIKTGFSSVLSDVDFDKTHNTIEIRPLRPVLDGTGAPIAMQEICSSLDSSLKASVHSAIAPLVTAIRCLDDKIKIEMTTLPANIRFLFTLADFAVFRPATLPFSPKHHPKSGVTGPYSIDAMTTDQVTLKLNPHYPAHLRANGIAEVTFRSYPASEALSKISEWDAQSSPLNYLYGYTLDSGSLEKLKTKGYRIRQTPSEWLVYLGLNPSVSAPDRKIFADAARTWRKEILSQSPLGVPAYSLSPSDRPFGLKGDPADLPATDTKALSRVYTLGTLDEWAKVPMFAATLDHIKKRFPEMKIKLFPRTQMNELYSSRVSIVLSPLGISPADPINDFTFLSELSDLIPRAELTKFSTESDQNRFNEGLLQIEKRVIAANRWVPLGHFPGVVAEANWLERDESLAWAWGIQTWTYRVSSK